MESNNIINLVKKLQELEYSIEGLNNSQISKIEEYYNVSLPFDYKYFLSNLGASGGGFLKGEDCFYDRIFELREYAKELLEDDNSSFVLEKKHFVFYSHQGYIFAFIDLTYKENSPVYYYFEGDLEPSIKYSSIAEFFYSFL